MAVWRYYTVCRANTTSPCILHRRRLRVKLIITNNHGCTDTARKNINVAAKPQVSFTGLNAQYCTGDNVTLVSNLLGSISQYARNTVMVPVFPISQPSRILILHREILRLRWKLPAVIAEPFNRRDSPKFSWFLHLNWAMRKHFVRD